MTAKKIILCAVLAGSSLLVGLGAPLLHAQTAPPTQITPSNDTGTNPYGSYSTDAGNVNLSNGNLNLNIPIVSLPGRNGHNFGLALQYDSKIWSPSATVNTSTDITYQWMAEQRNPAVGDMGWRLSIPGLDVGPYISDQSGNLIGIGDYFITLQDGSKHTLSARGTVMDAEDGSSMTLYQPNSPDVVVSEKDGTAIHFTGSETSGYVFSKTEDTNGNYFAANANGYVDALGRQITVAAGTSTPTTRSTLISYRDSNGVLQTTTLNLTQVTLFAATGSNATPQPPFTYPVQVNCYRPGCLHIWVHQPASTWYWMLTSVVLPDNTSYTFSYNGYGELTKVTYPTGGYTAYDYAAFAHLETYWETDALKIPGDFREVTGRRICRDPLGACSPTGIPEDLTTFNPTVDNTQPGNQQMDVVDPLGYKNHYEFSRVDDGVYARYSSSREILHSVYSETGALLRTTQTGYVYIPPVCICPAFPAVVATTLNDTGGTALVVLPTNLDSQGLVF
jgi:YD repeat-containing protein